MANSPATSPDHEERDVQLLSNGAVRKRKGTTRSREGCLVCRKRRVKCDETHPCCKRCLVTRRPCVWPDPSRRGNRAVVLAPAEPLRPALNDAAARPNTAGARALSYFQYKSAQEFAGYFDGQFWGVTVLQMGHREPCVNQLLVALGALHEGFRNEPVLRPDPDAVMLRHRANEEYTKAIRLFIQHIEEREWTSLDVTLTCAALCIAFEWLRGTAHDANHHLKESLNTMAQWLNGDAPDSNSTKIKSPQGEFIRTQLKPIFVTMALHTRTLNEPPKIPLPVIESEHIDLERFSNVHQARDSLVFLLAKSFPEAVSHYTVDPDTASPGDIYLQLEKWGHCLDKFIAEHEGMDRDPRVAILRLWHIGAKLLYYGENGDSELFYDKFSSDFESQVDLAEWLVSESMIPRCRFSIDMGALPTLYYTAVKCRHPGTRRRAIDLMKAWPRREAVYDSLACAALAAEIVKIEEGDDFVTCETDVPKSSRISGKIRSEFEVSDIGERVNKLWIKREGEKEWTDYREVRW
ncbi:C6 zinc finger domain protein [Colletotrichum truncatum]|uniref:C6 zinc finger domain protein n=1 Tax=Colletotrichum truncatum TaxID=5467 RepID=A0ACC3YHE1_COLTU